MVMVSHLLDAMLVVCLSLSFSCVTFSNIYSKINELICSPTTVS